MVLFLVNHLLRNENPVAVYRNTKIKFQTGFISENCQHILSKLCRSRTPVNQHSTLRTGSAYQKQVIIKPRPNDPNISTQHIATCCALLVTMLRLVAMCCDMLGVFASNLKMAKFFMQHLWMLYDVIVVWPGSCNNVAPGHAH